MSRQDRLEQFGLRPTWQLPAWVLFLLWVESGPVTLFPALTGARPPPTPSSWIGSTPYGLGPMRMAFIVSTTESPNITEPRMVYQAGKSTLSTKTAKEIFGW